MILKKLFCAICAIFAVGWIFLIPISPSINSYLIPFAEYIGALIGFTIIALTYILWKKPYLLRNKKVVIGLIIFAVIGMIGWVTSKPQMN